MAQITTFVDDFSGVDSKTDTTVRNRRVNFEEGTLTIDLSDESYGALMDALAPFISAGEWAERDSGDATENALIREWARKNGKDVSPRGRLSKDLVSEYREYLKSQERTAHGSSEGTSDTPVDSDSTDADNGSEQPSTPADA